MDLVLLKTVQFHFSIAFVVERMGLFDGFSFRI